MVYFSVNKLAFAHLTLQAGRGDVPITATDTSSDAGTRENTKTLKMVYKGEARTASSKSQMAVTKKMSLTGMEMALMARPDL
ncbi:MAG: hypothetical protein R3F23_01215 [Verrucomicrobiia bacterium]